MSFNSIVDNQINKSKDSLKQVSKTAGYLLEDVMIRIERQAIDPVLHGEASLLLASTVLHQASDVSITDSEMFLTFTSEHLCNQIFHIVGRSPGFLDDIIGGVQNLAQEAIDHSQNVYDDGVAHIQNVISDTVEGSGEVFDSFVGQAQDTTQDAIDWSQDVVDDGVGLVQGLAQSILDGIIGLGSMLLETVSMGVGFLGGILNDLFTFEIGDILNLQDDMTKAYEKKQKEKIAKAEGGG